MQAWNPMTSFCPEQEEDKETLRLPSESMLGPDIFDNMLFIHALFGCDMYNISPLWDQKGSFPQEIQS